MSGFNNFKSLVEAIVTEGKVKYSTWRKAPSAVNSSRIWFDLSMSPGNPVPNYYAASPLASKVLAQSTDGGIYHGADVSPAKKYLAEVTIMNNTATATPLPMLLCDYLMYYPFIDESTTDEQLMDNTEVLTRYTDGKGVNIMAVTVAAHGATTLTIQVKYTNQDGVSDRLTYVSGISTGTATGSIITSANASAGRYGPFLPLQAGDTGVRSIQSVTTNGADVGLFTLVLVKPLASLCLREITAPVEVSYIKDFPSMPEIKPDAYLNYICLPSGAVNGSQFLGDATFVWS